MAVDRDALETRIIELETRIAFQDRIIDSLDEVVREFASRVEMLERTVKLLQSSVPGAGDEDLTSERPPHY